MVRLEVTDSESHPGPLLPKRPTDFLQGSPGDSPQCWAACPYTPLTWSLSRHLPVVPTAPLAFPALITLFSPLPLTCLVNSCSLLQAPRKCPHLCHPSCPVVSWWLCVPVFQPSPHRTAQQLFSSGSPAQPRLCPGHGE